jgi:2-polyprenyl-3-methyl-5-hydroxy-6-metoxy-1,4-benzoquinol methylase
VTLPNFILGKIKRYSRAATIVDLGAGNGRIISYLMNKGYKNISGCDLDYHKVNQGINSNLPIYVRDALDYLNSIDNETVDVVLCVDFIEHIPKDLIHKYISAISSKLRNNGSLIMRMPNPDSPFFGRDFFNDPTHQWIYTIDSLKILLAQGKIKLDQVFDERMSTARRFSLIQIPIIYIARCLFALIMILIGITHRFNLSISPSVWFLASKSVPK